MAQQLSLSLFEGPKPKVSIVSPGMRGFFVIDHFCRNNAIPERVYRLGESFIRGPAKPSWNYAHSPANYPFFLPGEDPEAPLEGLDIETDQTYTLSAAVAGVVLTCFALAEWCQKQPDGRFAWLYEELLQDGLKLAQAHGCQAQYAQIVGLEVN